MATSRRPGPRLAPAALLVAAFFCLPLGLAWAAQDFAQQTISEFHGGNYTPPATATPSPTPSDTASATSSPSASPSGSVSPSASPTAGVTPSPSASPSAGVSPSASPTSGVSPSASASPSPSVSSSATASPTGLPSDPGPHQDITPTPTESPSATLPGGGSDLPNTGTRVEQSKFWLALLATACGVGLILAALTRPSTPRRRADQPPDRRRSR